LFSCHDNLPPIDGFFPELTIRTFVQTLKCAKVDEPNSERRKLDLRAAEVSSERTHGTIVTLRILAQHAASSVKFNCEKRSLTENTPSHFAHLVGLRIAQGTRTMRLATAGFDPFAGTEGKSHVTEPGRTQLSLINFKAAAEILSTQKKILK
jgi:hypothetical protein